MRASAAPHAVEVERRDARGAEDLHQRRRPRRAADLARHRRRAGADQHLDDGDRHAARASDHRRRQLHRPRVRADVPALRRARHGARVRRPADRARGPRGLARGAGDPRARGRRVPFLGARRARRAGRRTGTACASRSAPAAPPRDARRQPPARRRRPHARTPTTSASTGPASPSTRAATSPSTTSCAPASPASGRSATSTAAAPSRTPRTTTTRSSPPTCSTAARAASAIACPAYALFIDPPLGRVGMSEAEVRARGKPALVGVMPMTRVGRARERGETQGFMKVLVDAESERILGASLLCIEGDEIVHSLLDVMAADALVQGDRARRAHPSDGERADPDAARPARAARCGVTRDQPLAASSRHCCCSAAQPSAPRRSIVAMLASKIARGVRERGDARARCSPRAAGAASDRASGWSRCRDRRASLPANW